MTISTEPMKIPISPSAKEAASRGYMPYEERLARTVHVPGTVTHVRYGDQIIPANEFQDTTGMEVDTWRENIRAIKEKRTYCRIGGVAISLVDFERTHPHIELGKE